jgi:hypothetical protein
LNNECSKLRLTCFVGRDRARDDEMAEPVQPFVVRI